MLSQEARGARDMAFHKRGRGPHDHQAGRRQGKVYLDGIEQASGWSVDTRTSPLDVNLSGIATGQQLTWNGTALVPVTEPFDVGVHLPDLSTAGALLAEIVLARPQVYSSYRAEWLACV